MPGAPQAETRFEITAKTETTREYEDLNGSWHATIIQVMGDLLVCLRHNRQAFRHL